MLPSRAFELAAIDEFIERHGVTRCPSAFVARTTGLSTLEIARRIAAFQPKHPGMAASRLQIHRLLMAAHAL
jgi:hypothetical protein